MLRTRETLRVIVMVSFMFCLVNLSYTFGAETPNAFLWENGSIRPIAPSNFSVATSINNLGQVTGNRQGIGSSSLYGFLWINNNITDLGTLGGPFSIGHGINDLGQIVGWSRISNSSPFEHAFLWNNGIMNDLGTLDGIQAHSFANAINNQGEIVGWSQTNMIGIERAFLWQNGIMQGLEPSIGLNNCKANSINNIGQIVGYSYNKEQSGIEINRYACLWEHGNVVDLRGIVGDDSTAIDINNVGQVLVRASGKSFLLDNGTVTDLGNLAASSINDQGQIVGSMNINGTIHGFIWVEGKLQDIGSLDNYDFITIPYDINNYGQVVGYSYFAAPLPPSIILLGSGLLGLGLIGWRRRKG